MIILFSPSESKTNINEYGCICKESFIFQDLYAKRIEAVNIYNDYSGVSYSYLAYDTLSKNAKNYILNTVIIFSNLFGPVSAKDKIPHYKLKQGAKTGSFSFEKFYKDNFSHALDEYTANNEIVDLRAGFYEKFYQIKQKYTTFKFIKQGRVVSHFAKAYRGIILKLMAENNILESDKILSYLPETLEVIDCTLNGFKEEFILNVLD